MNKAQINTGNEAGAGRQAGKRDDGRSRRSARRRGQAKKKTRKKKKQSNAYKMKRQGRMNKICNTHECCAIGLQTTEEERHMGNVSLSLSLTHKTALRFPLGLQLRQAQPTIYSTFFRVLFSEYNLICLRVDSA